jgi:hypothetical protein
LYADLPDRLHVDIDYSTASVATAVLSQLQR